MSWLAKALFYQLADLAQVGAALQPGFELPHHQTHGAHTAGAGSLQNFINHGADFDLAKRRRQKFLYHTDFVLFLRDQIGAARVGE